MSSWGNTDNTLIAGTVTAYAANTRVVGSGTYFSINVKAGDYVTIATSGKYKVETVTSNTVLTLSTVATAVTGQAVYLQQGPKSIGAATSFAAARRANLVTASTVFGVDSAEAGTSRVASVAVNSAGTGYQRTANVPAATANTTATFTTTGASQPQANATATLTFANNVLTAITVTAAGKGYTAAARANTTLVIATTGAAQPLTNATATIAFTTSGIANASHTGWVNQVNYSTSQGSIRNKSEVLVAMSKNGITGDDEDTNFPD